MAKVTIAARFTRREYEALKEIAERECRSLSGSVRVLVREALEERRLLLDEAQQREERDR